MPQVVVAAPDAGAFHPPLYVAWELTHACNARCVHCYSSSGPSADRTGELSTLEALELIDQLAAAGVLVLAFSGGEPLMRPDWPTLVAHARSAGLIVNLGSNGANIDEATAAQLAEVGVSSVTISIDSHRPAVHDRFRRVPGLHAHAVRAVELLKKHALRVVVGFTPTRINHRDGPHVVAMSLRLGADAVNLSEYVPAGRGSTRLALAPAELRRVLQQWIALRDQHQGRIELQWHDCRVSLLETESRVYQGCGAGRLLARILPDGTVTPCVFLPNIVGSTRKVPFATLWERSPLLAALRQRRGHVRGTCGDCDHLDHCGGCRAVAHAYCEDLFGGDPHCWIRQGDTRVRLRVLRAFREEGLS